MKYLLDTHTILWYLFGNERLSKSAKNIIESNVCFYSYASFWEISIKQSKKKLEFTHTVYETDYLLRNEANAAHLKKSIEQHKAGKIQKHELL